MSDNDTNTDGLDAVDTGRRPSREGQDAKLWVGDGWTARIVANDDEGWAVEMTCDGESEPALVGPWTMGRDKKNPKPIDPSSFAVLVKTANEVRSRHLQQHRAQMHRSVNVVSTEGARLRVDLDVVADADDPHAILSVHDAAGAVVTRSRVSAGFKLTAESARRCVDGGVRDGADAG